KEAGVKASLPKIIRWLLLAVISCSAGAQDKHRTPAQERKPAEGVVAAEAPPVKLSAPPRFLTGVPGPPPGNQSLKPLPEDTTGIEPIPLWRGQGMLMPIPPVPLWRGQGMLMPIPPAEGPPNIVLVRPVGPKRSH